MMPFVLGVVVVAVFVALLIAGLMIQEWLDFPVFAIAVLVFALGVMAWGIGSGIKTSCERAELSGWVCG